MKKCNKLITYRPIFMVDCIELDILFVEKVMTIL